MKALLASLCLCAASIGAPAFAQITNRDIPPDAKWYLHINMQALRNSEAGSHILDWVNAEVTDDMEDDIGFNAAETLDSAFFYGNAEGSFAARILGDFDDDVVERLREQMLENTDTQLRNDGWGEYYVLEDLDDKIDTDSGKLQLDTDTIFVSFAKPGALFITSSAQRLESEIKGIRGGNQNVLVLDARAPFLQIGVNTDELLVDGDHGFNSDLLRQTSKVALTVGTISDAFDIHTRVTATDPKVTDSMANIVRGLISLRMLSSEIPEPVGRIVDKVRVESDSSGMSIRLNVTANEVRALSAQ